MLSIHNFSWGLGAVALGLAGYIPLYAFMRAVKDTPVGIVSPICGGSSLIAVILSAVFLHTTLTSLQWLAALVIILANMAMTFEMKGFRKFANRPHAEGIVWSFAAAFGWGCFFFLLVPFTEKLGAWNAALLVEIGVLIAALTHMQLTRTLPSFQELKRPSIILNGALIAAGTVLFTIGVRSYSVPIVQILSNSTAFAASYFGYVLLHEHLNRRERIAGSVITIGVITLAALSN
jgi:drug/metabolite transporter (DMT)-like permease